MRHSRPSRYRPAILAVALVLCAAPAGADHHVGLHLSGDLGLGYDSNVSNAASNRGGSGWDSDLRDSAFASGALHLTHHYRPSLYTTLLTRGSVLAEAYERYGKLSNGKVMGALRLVHRPAGGFFMPTFAAWGSAAWWEFGSQIRDSAEYRGGVYVMEQITTEVSVRLNLSASRRDSRSRVFDLSGTSAGLNVDWRAGPAVTLYGGYQNNRGDVVSTARAYGYPSGVAEPDDAFGDSGGGGGQYAYRQNASAHIGSLGFNLPLSSNLSLDTQALYIDSRADLGWQYTRWITAASLLARF